MKNLVVVLLLLVFWIQGKTQWFLGVHAGPGFSKIEGSTNNFAGYKPDIRPYAGVILRKRITRKVSIITGMDYVLQGGIKTGMQEVPSNLLSSNPALGSTLYGDFHRQLKMAYLEFPLHARITIHVTDHLFYYVLLGPELGINVAADIKSYGTTALYYDMQKQKPVTENDGGKIPFYYINERIDKKEQVKPLNVSGAGAVGIEYQLGDSRIGAEGRFVQGFTNINKSDFPDQRNWANNVSVFLTYSILICKTSTVKHYISSPQQLP